jgi:CheY-like chemotaxis protein
MGYSDLAMRRIAPEDALAHHIEEIKKASERASGLTRQLLAFSRRQVLQPRVLDLNAFVLELNKMLARLIGEDIQMRVKLDSQLGQVRADPSQIQQVIMNLAVNARDAMPAGGMLTIETANVELDQAYSARNVGVEPGPYVMLAITDSGAGMNQKMQQHIFEPFYTTKETGKGTGLGLSTVHGIIKQSGGHVSVDSQLGHGSTFKIYLPRIDALADKIDLSPRPKDLHQGNATILIVEDEDIVRAIAVSTLELSGYEILDAASGEEALLICKQHHGPIHLLLTDVVMPRMSGKEVAERLSKLRPDMKVLFMSGYTTDAVVHHGILDVGTAFIEKPFTPEELAQKVREVLDDSD